MKRPFFLSLCLSLAIIFAGLCGVYGLYLHLKPELPSIDQLENIEPSLITKVYSEDDVLLQEFYTERRIWRTLDEIPPFVWQAVLSIEDKRFWYHWGMNIYSLPDIMMEAVFYRKTMRGGSTLTQQLARNLYSSIGRERTLFRKIKELFTAFQIEKTYTKEDILQFYLNQVYMGGGAYGFQAAAQKYFGKSTLSELSLAEAATLAALIQLPEYYRPDAFPEHAVRRRNLVLKAMLDDAVISRADYVKAVAEPVAVVEQEGKAGKAPYFVEMIRSYLEKKYGARALYSNGFVIRTTLNYAFQEKAEAISSAWLDSLQYPLDTRFISTLSLVKRFGLPADTIRAHIEDYPAKVAHLFRNEYSPTETEIDSTGKTVPKIIREALHDSLKYRKVQIAFAVLDNKTGAIRALIGGRDFEKSKFNRVTQAFRQPGSAFKPFIYTAAMDNGYTPCTVMLDQAFSIPDPILGEWRPENYNREFNGEMTLRRALALSINTVAIKLQQKVGTATVINYAVNMGLNRSHLAAVPSLAIGSCEAIPLSIFSAYSAFPNSGVRADPYTVTEIYDRQENVVESHYPIMHDVLNPRTAYVMTSMLRSVVQYGTAASAPAKGLNAPAGGKTGTTNDYTDAWFIGFTSRYTCGVWTGIDDKWSLGNGCTGNKAALPIWTDFMLYLYDSLKTPREDFSMPSGVITQKICRVSWMIAREQCDSLMDEVFIIGTEPGVCDRDHAVRKENDAHQIDPFGTRRPSTGGQPDSVRKKGSRVFMM